MVDEVRLLRLLRHVDGILRALHDEQSAPNQRRADSIWLAGIKYLMITGIEGCIDIAQHACSSERLGLPADNSDSFRVLARYGYLREDTAAALVLATGFRNVLVHEYIEVDDTIVLRRLQDLSDLHEFIAQASAWLTPTDPTGSET